MNLYYSSNELFSHQAMVNFVMGERGNGKSFDAKKRMIKNFINKGEQSVYVRRRQTDIDEVKDVFFDDLLEHFPNLEFKVDGKYGYINGEKAIIFMALSTSLKKKSSPFPKVTLIVFDEYIEPSFKNPGYLKNDMFFLLEMINTIVRKRDNWKLLIIGNVLSFVNPFFSMYNIQIKDTKKRFHKFEKDVDDGTHLICIELTDTPEFRESYSKTKFAKLIKHTSYGGYAMGGQAYEDNSDYILDERKGTHIFICSLYSMNMEVGLWYNEQCNVYCDDIIESDSKKRYYIFDEDMKESLINIKSLRNTWRARQIIENYREGKMYYKNQEIKKFMMNIIKYIG